MSDFLYRLAGRALGLRPGVRPVLPSRFDPLSGAQHAATAFERADRVVTPRREDPAPSHHQDSFEGLATSRRRDLPHGATSPELERQGTSGLPETPPDSAWPDVSPDDLPALEERADPPPPRRAASPGLAPPAADGVMTRVPMTAHPAPPAKSPTATAQIVSPEASLPVRDVATAPGAAREPRIAAEVRPGNAPPNGPARSPGDALQVWQRVPATHDEPEKPTPSRAAPVPTRFRVASQPASLAVPSDAEPAPTVRVTIGRIDVRAVAAAPVGRPPKTATTQSLDDYLRHRQGARR
jgi:hypothetical protein